MTVLTTDQYYNFNYKGFVEKLVDVMQEGLHQNCMMNAKMEFKFNTSRDYEGEVNIYSVALQEFNIEVTGYPLREEVEVKETS